MYDAQMGGPQMPKFADKQYRDVKNYSCMFEISRLSAARQLGQPMHSQSDNFGKFKLNSHNLAGIFLHNLYLRFAAD